jgi:hypothetical protein
MNLRFRDHPVASASIRPPPPLTTHSSLPTTAPHYRTMPPLPGCLPPCAPPKPSRVTGDQLPSRNAHTVT